jgi:uncharacterized protein (TIGR02145 family)
MSANTYQLARIPILKRTTGYYLRWWYNGWHHWYFYAGSLALKTTGEDYRTYGQRSVTVNSGQLTGSQVAAVRTIANSTEVYVFTDTGWRLVRLVAGTVQVQSSIIDGYELEFTLDIGSRLISVTGFSPVAVMPVAQPDDQCEVVIGSQIWACRNWDAPYPASRVYNDDEANRALYGGLYTYDQINTAGFAPAGWRVPTKADWDTLVAYLGGLSVAGGKLKATGTDYWNTPNTDADNESGFGARGGGMYGLGFGYFNLKTYGYFWAIGTYAQRYAFVPKYDSGVLLLSSFVPPTNPVYQPYLSVRLIKDTQLPYAVADADGVANIIVGGEGFVLLVDMMYCHGSLNYNGFIYGSARNYAFGQVSKAGGWLYKVDGDNYANAQAVNFKWADANDASAITHLEQICREGDALFMAGVASYIDPLDPDFPIPRNALIRIDAYTLSWQVFKITETYGYNPYTPLVADDIHIYYTTTSRIIKYLASDFEGYGTYNTEVYGSGGVPIAPVATLQHTLHGTTNKPLHAAIADDDFLYLSFIDTATDASVLLKVQKSDMTFVDSVAIPVCSDDIAQTATHVFLGVETTAGKSGADYAVIAIKKDDLTVTTLRKHSTEAAGKWSYGVYVYEVDGVSYLFDLRTDGKISIIDYTNVATWDGDADCDTEYAKRISFTYSDGLTYAVSNELILGSDDILHAFLWDSASRLQKFKIGVMP